MTRFGALGALIFAVSLAAPAAAADRNVKLTLDGRPVDRQGGVAVLHNGVIYADVVDLVKSFNGLLTFQGTATVISIGASTATITVGSRTMKLNGGALTMRGPVFVRNGDPYVPLDAFITQVAKAKVRVSPDRTRADISVNANPLS